MERSSAPRRRRRLPGRSGSPGAREQRIPIPPALVRMVERGLERPEGTRASEGWWRWVEARMHRHVRGQLPPVATDLRLTLDESRLEVVARFHVPGGAGRPGTAARRP